MDIVGYGDYYSCLILVRNQATGRGCSKLLMFTLVKSFEMGQYLQNVIFYEACHGYSIYSIVAYFNAVNTEYPFE